MLRERLGGFIVGGKIPNQRKLFREDMSDWSVVVSKYGVEGASKVRDVGLEQRTSDMIRRLWMLEDRCDIEEVDKEITMSDLEQVLMDEGIEPAVIEEFLGGFIIGGADVEADQLENIFQDILDQDPVDEQMEIVEEHREFEESMTADPREERLEEIRQDIEEDEKLKIRKKKSRSAKQKEQDKTNSERMKAVQKIRKEEKVSLKEAWAIYRKRQ